MPFSVPSQASVVKRVKADYRTETGANPLRRSIELGLLMALAGQSKGLYSFAEFIFRQCFPTTADAHYLWRWAAIWGVTQRAAAPWEGVVRFTGTDTTAIPAGTSLSRSDGTLYETTEEGTISGGQVDVPAVAQDDFAGASSSLEDGDPLVLTGSISGVDSDVEVVSTTVDGSDVEDPEDGLVRLLQRIAEPPSGGAANDYIRWALENEGVTRAWASSPAPGDVFVYFVRDDDGAGAAIIPSGGERTAVEAYVQERAPITAEVACPALTALLVEVEISDLSPDTSDVRDAIEEALEDFFYREAEPGGTINLSRLQEAISGAIGENSHVLVSPAADVVADADEMPVFDGLVVS